MQGGLRLGTLAGIEIRIHYTWLFAFVLIAWSLAQGYFPISNAGLGTGTYWILGVVSALLLFGSVLVHELGHSLLAGARGLHVDSITLFIFGGVSSITKEASTARDEFLIAVVGPVTSLVLAGLFWLLGQLLPPDSAVAAVTSYLAFTNLLLAGFNIVPGFPLDGGRVLRSIVWGATGNLPRATRIASYVGQAVAFGMIAWGVSRLLGGDVFGGLWTAFIGWFLNSGAEASRQQQTVRAVLGGVPVTAMMDTSPAGRRTLSQRARLRIRAHSATRPPCTAGRGERSAARHRQHYGRQAPRARRVGNNSCGRSDDTYAAQDSRA